MMTRDGQMASIDLSLIDISLRHVSFVILAQEDYDN